MLPSLIVANVIYRRKKNKAIEFKHAFEIFAALAGLDSAVRLLSFCFDANVLNIAKGVGVGVFQIGFGVLALVWFSLYMIFESFK